MKATILIVLMFIGLSMAAVMESRTINVDQLAKIRCSLNPVDETFFFFNGSVIAYLTNTSAPENKVLFKTVGINVGRCFKNAIGSYTLASRELLYYIDPVTDQILDTWTNIWTGESVHVAHVDNDPVLQTFYPSNIPIQVYEDKAFLNLDIPLLYNNSLFGNSTFLPYSPQRMYQAGEFFKFIFPVANLDQDIDTVDYSLVSWTRQGPFLPWMSMGDTQGHLIYSSAGSRIPSWEYLPGAVLEDVAGRIPHYKHAPLCSPNTTSVTSWNFFKNHYSEWLAGARFPLAEAAVYPCFPGTEITEPTQGPATQAPTNPATNAPTNGPTPTPTLPACAPVTSNAFRVGASLIACIVCFAVALF